MEQSVSFGQAAQDELGSVLSLITAVGLLLGLERFLDEFENRRILLQERLAHLIISAGQGISTLPLDDLRLR
jgi:hypothetical protein